MKFMNDFRKIDPKMVVNKTMNSVTMIMKLLFWESIWRHKAKAIAPRIRPEYQHTFIYFDSRGNLALQIMYESGRTYIDTALAIGRMRSNKAAIPKAFQFPSIPRIQIP